MDRRRGTALIGMLGLAGALITAVPAMAQDQEEPKAQLKWAACPADVKIPPTVAVQCASVPVPLDYSDPDATQIEIMISKIAGTNPQKRRGVLMFNPGGPGGSGLNFPATLVNKGIPASVTDTYDLIGMDTRGIGHSSPISCGLTTDDPYFMNVPPYAENDAAVAEQAQIAEAIAAKCAANDKDGRARHLSTANKARDLDSVRAALGEKKASFFGASYGSALGAAYASMFPDTTDRIVLDSNVGDTHLDRDGLRRYALGMEQTFPGFAKWVAARHDSYGLGRTPQQVRKTFDATAEKLDKTPAADGTDGAVFRYAVWVGLFGESLYGNTARMWQSYLNLVAAPAAKAPAAPNPADNNLSVFLTVTCNDINWPEDLGTYRRAVAEDRKRYPMYGAAAANVLPCAYWKYEPTEPPVKINDNGPRNILILQNRYDPVTPLEGAKVLRAKFAKRSQLVTANGSGHGVYVMDDNACALGITTSFLVDGKLPAKDTTCRN